MESSDVSWTSQNAKTYRHVQSANSRSPYNPGCADKTMLTTWTKQKISWCFSKGYSIIWEPGPWTYQHSQVVCPLDYRSANSNDMGINTNIHIKRKKPRSLLYLCNYPYMLNVSSEVWHNLLADQTSVLAGDFISLPTFNFCSCAGSYNCTEESRLFYPHQFQTAHESFRFSHCGTLSC